MVGEAAAVSAAAVAVGEMSKAIYPNNPFALPHLSSGYPGHWRLQSETEVVTPGASLEHQQSSSCRIAKAQS